MIGPSAIISGIQIEYGDTATDYEAYDKEHIGKYKIPITVSGKNLFDISKVTTFLGTDYKTNRDTYSSISGGIITSKIGAYADSAILYDSKVSLPAGTYTVSADFMADKDSGNKEIGIGICFTNLGKTNVSYHNISDYRVWERKSHTFTLDEETDIAIITQGTGIKDDYMDLNIKIKNIQLENEKKITDYEAYYNKTYDIYLDEPLRKLGDAVDYIDFKQSKVVRNVKEENGVLSKLEIPKIESISLPEVLVKSGTNIITVGTSVTPSNFEVVYNKEK